MINKKSLENLQPNVFSSTNQPPSENKRVPKIKTRMKKVINDNWDKFKDMIKEKNTAAWSMALDRAYGKVKDRLEVESRNKNYNIDYTNLTEEEAKELFKKKQQEMKNDK
jgi:hypothetical protein